MQKDLGDVKLKTGETVHCSVVQGPSPEWRDAIGELLSHKGGLWNEHIKRALLEDLILETRFYLLHRDDKPFANIMTTESHGSGIFGHVYTVPDDRRKGAASLLNDKLMADAESRGCKALFLGTAYDSPAYHIYKRYGFEGIEPGSGYMYWFAEGIDAFSRRWFAKGETKIETVAWKHWGSSPALTMFDLPGVVKLAGSNLNRRASTEYGLLPMIATNERNAEAGKPAVAKVLVQQESGAIVGLAAHGADAMWPDTRIVDVYCHPDFWDDGETLFDDLVLPEDQRLVAYADATCPEKAQLLASHGFREVVTLPNHAKAAHAGSERVDVLLMERA